MRKNKESLFWISSLVFILVILAFNSKTGGKNNIGSLSLLSITGTPTAYDFLPVIYLAESSKTPTPTPTPTQTPTETLTPTLASTPTPTSTPTDIIWEMLDQVNLDRVLNNLRLLTGETPICMDNECYTIKNRQTGSEGLFWAKKYIYNELISFRYTVEFQDWSRSGYTDQNLIARKLGETFPEEEIYFVAHVDGVNPNSRKRYPAADDNASGVVDMMELARILSNYSFSRTLVLLFTTGEEQGALGAKSYLSQLSPDELSSIKYVINIDMIGYDANQDEVMELWNGDHSPSLVLAQMMSEIIQVYQLDLSPSIVSGCT